MLITHTPTSDRKILSRDWVAQAPSFSQAAAKRFSVAGCCGTRIL